MDVPLRIRQTPGCPDGGQFYQCSSPQYMGCCLVDACRNGGCPANQDRTPSNALPNGSPTANPSNAKSTSSPSSKSDVIASSSTRQTVFVTVTRNATPTAQSTADNAFERAQPGENRIRASAIAGGVVGSAVLLSFALLILFFVCRKKHKKERRRATLPPPYSGGGDMSEQLTSTTAPADSESKAIPRDEPDPNGVPQLDSTVIIPTNEADVDALGNIPELPAIERNVGSPSEQAAASCERLVQTKSKRKLREDHNHVMSWAHFNSMGKRDPSARLSQPHIAPETSTEVWENMSPKKPRDGLSN